jgi:hypothetical protein
MNKWISAEEIHVNHLSVKIAAIAGISLIATQGQAAVCDPYVGAGETALEGTSVCFVYDPNDIDPKYGTPSVSGDTIFVTPTSFLAESNNTDGNVTTTGTGTIQIIAKSGYVLDGINFGEVGDYRMTAGAESVDVDPFLRVFEWGAVPTLGAEETLFVPVTGDLTIKDDNLHNWSASGGFDLTTSTWDDINRVGLTLQNTLSAVSLVDGEGALIQKKAIGSSVDVTTSTVVPVPAAVWLFGSGLLGLVGVARRRGNS